jgi:hypothetical protein
VNFLISVLSSKLKTELLVWLLMHAVAEATMEEEAAARNYILSSQEQKKKKLFG